MRGTRVNAELDHAMGGITPAYAGNTLLSLLSGVSLKDHPRVCGEHQSVNNY